MEKEPYLISKDLGVVLEYQENWGYTPIIYHADIERGEGKSVSDNPMLVNWLAYQKKANRRLSKDGKRTIERNLYYEQHALAVNLLVDIQECKSSKWLINVARQFGKICPFI